MPFTGEGMSMRALTVCLSMALLRLQVLYSLLILQWNWGVHISLWSANLHEQDMQASLFIQAFKSEQPHTSAVFLSIISTITYQSVNRKFPAQLHKVA